MDPRNKNNEQRGEQDPQLGPPSQANENKHINFREEEDNIDDLRIDDSREDVKERREEWERGLKEGKRGQPHFQKKDLDEQEEY